MRGLLARLRDIVFRSRADREMDEELAFHIEMETRKNVRDGMSPQEAKRVAMAHFGGLERHRERLREGRQAPLVEPVMRDVRVAVRAARRSPGFTLVAVLTIALGIGATSSVFSIVNTLLLQPPSLPSGDGLVVVDEMRRGAMSSGTEGWKIPFSRYQSYAEGTRDVFSGLAGRRFETFAVRLADVTEAVQGARTSGNYFSVLGITPAAGRFYSTDLEASVVLSHRLWRDYYQSDPAVVGELLYLNSRPLTIVGVAPRGFTGASIAAISDVWMPIGANDADLRPQAWTSWVAMLGRLRPGVDTRTAEAAATTVALTVPPDESQTTVRSAEVAKLTGVPANGRTVVAGFLGMLLAMAGLVLLIAGSNIAGMLMARTFARRREMAVRLAIGSGRVGLVRHLLAEGLLVFLLGGAAGVALAYGGTTLIARIPLPAQVPFDLQLTPDGTVLLFSLVVTGAVGLLFSLLPALQASRPDLVPALKDGGRAGPVAGSKLRSVFVTGQVAMATLLLVVATLFGRSLQKALTTDLGLEYRGVVVATTNLDPHGYDRERGRLFYDELAATLRGTAGVESVGLSQFVPLNGDRSGNDVHNGIEGEGYRRTNASVGVIGPDFFGTLGLDVVAGRGFNSSDAEGGAEVVIVNETLAERIWPGQNPVGRILRMGGRSPEVVGLAADSKYTFVSESPQAFVYQAFAQVYRGRMALHVRAPGHEAAALEAIREAVRALDPNVAVEGAHPMTEVVEFSLFPHRFAAGLVGLFGIIGLVLAALGVYGVLAFQVAQRTRELGIRRALGANGTDLVSQVVRSGALLALVGCGVGVVLGGGLASVMGSFLVGLARFDPVTFLGVPLVLVAVALVASTVPALRAVSVDATEALREE